MKDKFKKLLFSMLLMSATYPLFAQESKIGVSATMEATNDNLVIQSYGIDIDKSFSEHWGFETGVNYKKNVFGFMDINYISVPLAARFYSSFVNVSLGAEANFYNNITLYPGLAYNSNIAIDAFKLTYFTSISKAFCLNSRIIVEPGIKINLFNPITSAEANFGIGIKLRYKL